MSKTIPFEIPEKFMGALQNGSVQQVGALLKDVQTGQIVGHLQETGAMQNFLSNLVATGPVGASVGLVTDVAGVAQGFQTNQKLNALQSAVGGMQSLQMVTALTSFAGIGVTVASTVLILKRMKAVQNGISRLEDKVDELPAKWRELELRKTLTGVVTQLERLEETTSRKDPKPVFEVAEAKLHGAFNELAEAAQVLVGETKFDAALLGQVLSGLAVSGGAQVKALFYLDEVETAANRSKAQFSKLQELAMAMPADRLLGQLNGDSEAVAEISQQASALRGSVASQPILGRHLIGLGLSGKKYLEHARDEQDEPLLILPAQ